jgi:hypothetical protein
MANHSKLDYDPYKSSYGRHVSGKWLDPPVVFVGHGVNRKFHYWKDVIERLSPARFKEPEAALLTEAPIVIRNHWVTTVERMDTTYLKYIMAEKHFGTEAARKALSYVEQSKPVVNGKNYDQLHDLFTRTWLTARVYEATAKAYFGYRVFSRGKEYQSSWLKSTIQSGLDSMIMVASEIEKYPGKVPEGQWKWRNDAVTARKYHQLITETGWKEYGGVVFK